MIELAALDIAGTTLEEHGSVYAALRTAVSGEGPAPLEEEVRRWMGAEKREAIRALLSPGSSQAPSSATVDRVYDDFRERLLDSYRRQPPRPFPGIEEALARLRSDGVRVALTTGFEREITDFLLASVGWDGDLLDAVVCGDEVAAGRPAPFMIFRAMEATGVIDVARVLVAGDTPLDLEAGSNAGARAVVGVLTGGLDAATLGRVAHTHLLPRAADLPDLVIEASSS